MSEAAQARRLYVENKRGRLPAVGRGNKERSKEKMSGKVIESKSCRYGWV
jgi:hypothetical protein